MVNIKRLVKDEKEAEVYTLALQSISEKSRGAASDREALQILARRRYGTFIRDLDYDSALDLVEAFILSVCLNHGIKAEARNNIPDQLLDGWIDHIVDHYGYMTDADFKLASSGLLYTKYPKADRPEHYQQLSERYLFWILESYEKYSRDQMSRGIKLLEASRPAPPLLEAPKSLTESDYRQYIQEAFTEYLGSSGDNYLRTRDALGTKIALPNIRAWIMTLGEEFCNEKTILDARILAVQIRIKRLNELEVISREYLISELERLNKLKQHRKALEEKGKSPFKRQVAEDLVRTRIDGTLYVQVMAIAELALCAKIFEEWSNAGLDKVPVKNA